MYICCYLGYGDTGRAGEPEDPPLGSLADRRRVVVSSSVVIVFGHRCCCCCCVLVAITICGNGPQEPGPEPGPDSEPRTSIGNWQLTTGILGRPGDRQMECNVRRGSTSRTQNAQRRTPDRRGDRRHMADALVLVDAHTRTYCKRKEDPKKTCQNPSSSLYFVIFIYLFFPLLSFLVPCFLNLNVHPSVE